MNFSTFFKTEHVAIGAMYTHGGGGGEFCCFFFGGGGGGAVPACNIHIITCKGEKKGGRGSLS